MPQTYNYNFPHPAVTTDIVLFTVRDGALNLLLVRRARAPFAGAWALPGGFVRPQEDLDTCALRELREETGIRDVYLEQLYTFGDPDRDPRERVITVAYYALVASDGLELRASTDAEAAQWHAFDALPKLAFDHARIVRLAHERLAAKSRYSTLAFQFLPRDFTLNELQAVYETILQKPIDNRNFRKWIRDTGVVSDTGEVRRGMRHRPARLYRASHTDGVAILR